jgi:hypothetical protein
MLQRFVPASLSHGGGHMNNNAIKPCIPQLPCLFPVTPVCPDDAVSTIIDKVTFTGGLLILIIISHKIRIRIIRRVEGVPQNSLQFIFGKFKFLRQLKKHGTLRHGVCIHVH